MVCFVSRLSKVAGKTREKRAAADDPLEAKGTYDVVGL